MASTIFSDIDIELNQQTDGDIKKYTDHDAIKDSIRNILTTSKGTRRMLPEFGANLDELLFEPIDEHTMKLIGRKMLDEITAWEPRIEIDNINITGNADYGQYNIIVYYHILGMNDISGAETVKFILKQS